MIYYSFIETRVHVSRSTAVTGKHKTKL